MEGTDRVDFERLLAELFGALDKPLTEAKREGFWKGLVRMSLVEFARCRDQLLSELQEAGAPKSFGVSDVWAAKRRLRAPPVLFEHEKPKDDWKGDHWDIAANRHLLAYLLGHRIPGRGPSYAAMRDPTRLEDKILDASPEFVANVKTLVAYKNAWAQDMRDEVAPSLEFQRKCWDECMERAKAAFAQREAA